MADQGKPSGARNKSKVPARLLDTDVEAWVQMARAYHRIVRRLEQALDEFQITLAQFEVLCRLHHEGEMTQTELAQCLLVTKGNVCGLVDRMADAGLVQRKSDPADRRANKLTATAKGRSLYAELLPQHIDLIKELMGDLSEREQHSLCQALTKLAGDSCD